MRLIVSIADDQAEAVIASAQSALQTGADLVELRLDQAAPDQVDALVTAATELPRGRWIATLRSEEEGGRCTRSANDRRAILLRAAVSGAGYIDVERRDAAAPFWHDGELGDAGLIVSQHCLEGIPVNPAGILRQLRELRGNVHGAAKLAWACRDIAENLTALDLMRGVPGERIVIAMGEKGVISRVLARKCGAFGTFCAPDDGPATAAGQVTVGAMLEDLGWVGQTANTQLFGVIGSPIAHSMSPAIFNAQFRKAAANAVYLPLRVDSERELRGFLEGCRSRPWLNARGFSVTVPHKHAALGVAGQLADPLTRRIGAANTLDFMEDGIAAYNTDYAGALGAIAAGMGVAEDALTGMRVTVLGAGGVARAVVAGLTEKGAKVTIYNRSAPRASALSSDFNCQTGDWDDRQRHNGELLINCTSLGMQPAVEETPMSPEGLRRDLAVFDTVYNPRETRLLRLARAAGCRTIDGVAMFVQQAAAQYLLWMSRVPDTELFERIVSDRLGSARRTGGQGE
ncbi:MAG: type I 3-dehydroquinate dehydratase [Phycisphaerales bacterium]|nr:type I 3-dehydroquinate dehydratase [Phycisphaerales bacterium]